MPQHLAFLGGSFDPFHLGHRHVLDTIDSTLHPDKLLVIPNFQNPLKTATVAPACHRIEMCRLGISDHPQWEVWTWEALQAAPSYTIETVHELLRQFPGWRITMAIGDDCLNSIQSWHRYAELIRQVNIVVISRLHSSATVSDLLDPFPKSDRSRYSVIHAPIVSISASEIRRAAQTQMSFSRWVPNSVSAYILSHKVYHL